jgi:hypothetical protein
MNLESLSTYLMDAGLDLVAGTNLFATEMPATCTTGVLLLEPYNGTPIDLELPGYVNTEFRVVVRSDNYDSGKALALAVSAALTVPVETQLTPEMFVKRCNPMTKPRPYRRSVGALWEFEVDVGIVYVETA